MIEYINSYFVVIATNIFYMGELHIGYKNILYLLLIHHYKQSYHLNDDTMCALVGIPLYYKIVSVYYYNNKICNIESCSFTRDMLLYFTLFLWHMFIV